MKWGQSALSELCHAKRGTHGIRVFRLVARRAGGIAIAPHCPSSDTCFVGYMSRFQIAPEERALEARFGKEFKAYAGHVRRWL